VLTHATRARRQVSEGALLALRATLSRAPKAFEPHFLKLLPSLVRARACALHPPPPRAYLRAAHTPAATLPLCAACMRLWRRVATAYAFGVRLRVCFLSLRLLCASQVDRLADSKAPVRDAARDLILQALTSKVRLLARALACLRMRRAHALMLRRARAALSRSRCRSRALSACRPRGRTRARARAKRWRA
jgi:hypothetical protein